MSEVIRDPAVWERMRITFDLWATAVRMRRQKLRRDHPELSAEEIEEKVLEWCWTRPGAEEGDGPGVPAPWLKEKCKPIPSNRS